MCSMHGLTLCDRCCFNTGLEKREDEHPSRRGDGDERRAKRRDHGERERAPELENCASAQAPVRSGCDEHCGRCPAPGQGTAEGDGVEHGAGAGDGVELDAGGERRVARREVRRHAPSEIRKPFKTIVGCGDDASVHARNVARYAHFGILADVGGDVAASSNAACRVDDREGGLARRP